MNNKRGKDMAASIRDQLLNLARDRAEDFQLILTQYGLERLLYRLGKSEYRDLFVLKGAMLFMLWDDKSHRPTRDVDFLGFGDISETRLRTVFHDLCEIPVEDDGLKLISDGIQVEEIRDDKEYGGMRVKLFGELAGARISIQADIGFGDAVTPDPRSVEYPTLLNSPAPKLMAYPQETVVAEKYQALVSLGMANSRMKDFYDLWFISGKFGFDGLILSKAIGNTFSRRQTPLPEHVPLGLSSEFYKDSQKITQWNAFVRKGKLTASPPTLENICLVLQAFLLLPTQALVREEEFRADWLPNGPWR